MGEFAELYLYLGTALVVVGGAILGSRAKKAAGLKLLLEVAKLHDLRVVNARGPDHLAGMIGAFRVQVRPLETLSRLEIIVDGSPLKPLAQLAFHPEPGPSLFTKKSSDPQVGDHPFDRAVKMDLPEVDPGFALLSSELRRALTRLTNSGGFFEKGRLVVRSRPCGKDQDWTSFPKSEISALIEQGLETAELLRNAYNNPIATLSDTARRDPNKDIRLQAVCLLAELHGDSEAAQDVLVDLQRNEDSAVQLEACLRGKPRDYQTVRRIIADSSAPAVLRARAIAALPTDELGRLRSVDRAMLTERADIEVFEVLEAILQKFVITDCTPEFGLLERAARRSTDRGRLAAVRLASRGDTPHFDWLVDLLDPRYPISSVGVAQALGASGNARATVHLQRLLTERETPDDLKRAGRAALDLLRANLGHRGGGLSVTEHKDGRVSLVEAKEGALSRPGATAKKQST